MRRPNPCNGGCHAGCDAWYDESPCEDHAGAIRYTCPACGDSFCASHAQDGELPMTNDPKKPYAIPLGKLSDRPDPETCDHRWATDEDGAGETYWYCEHGCGSTKDDLPEDG